MKLNGNLHLELLLGLALRGGSAISSFAISIFVARLFGADVFGLYQIGIATATLAASLVGLGLDTNLVRLAGRKLPQNETGDVGEAYRQSRRIALRFGAGIMVLTALAAWPLSQWVISDGRSFGFILVMLPIILFLPLMRLSNALLRSIGRVFASQTLEGVSYSTLTLAGLGCLAVFGATNQPLAPALLYSASIVAVALIAVLLAHRTVSDWPEGTAKITPLATLPILAAPLIMTTGEWLVLMTIAKLGSVADAGIYRVAFQVCMLFQLVNTSFAMMAGPHLSRAAGSGDRLQFVRTIRTAGLIGLLLCAPLAVAAIGFPGQILSIFGPEFLSGALALQLLVAAQVVNVGFGPVGVGLVMLHKEKRLLVTEAIASLAVVGVAAATIGSLGIVGASFGILTGSVLRNAINFLLVGKAAREIGRQNPARVSQEARLSG